MNRHREAADRRALLLVVGLVFGGMLVLLLLEPKGTGDVALAAARVSAEQLAAEELEAMRLDAARDVRGPAVVTTAAVAGGQRSTAARPVVGDGRVPGWVEALRDDGIRGNAMDAMQALVRLPPGPIPELEAALASYDRQQRHMAAGILRRRFEHRGCDAPSPELLTVSVDALRADLDVGVRGTFLSPLKRSSLVLLSDHALAARGPLVRALGSADAQQRFFAAFLLARGRVPGVEGRAAYVLVQHLGDNRIGGDALMATHALYRLGEPALPVMADSRRYADEQARALLELIELDLRQPPRDLRELVARGSGRRISSLYHDAAIEYDLRRSSLPYIAGR